MNHGYGERYMDLSLTVDKVGEDSEGNHLVEVSVHDPTEEINVRLWVSKEFYGSMIPWLAARVVLADLAASSLERVRRLEAGRMEPGVRIDDKKAYLKEMDSAFTIHNRATWLPEHMLRGHMFFLAEGKEPPFFAASIHNARKLIFDRGLPDVVEFLTDEIDFPVVLARWQGRPELFHEHRFYGFDWTTLAGQEALSDFLGMLNLRKPFDLSDIRSRRIPRRKGPKEWSPYEMQSFMLTKGQDYGRPSE